MLLLAIVLAATALENTFPPCTPEQPLTPAQAALGADYDTDASEALTPDTITQTYSETSDDRTTDARVRSGACASRIVAVGTVRGAVALLSPGRRAVWTEYSVEVEQVFRQDANAPAVVGQTITVARDGGAVCTSAGTFRTTHAQQSLLTNGQRVLLFLTPKHGRYLSSLYDWTLGPQTASLAHSHPIAAPVTDVLARAGAVRCE